MARKTNEKITPIYIGEVISRSDFSQKVFSFWRKLEQQMIPLPSLQNFFLRHFLKNLILSEKMPSEAESPI